MNFKISKRVFAFILAMTMVFVSSVAVFAENDGFLAENAPTVDEIMTQNLREDTETAEPSLSSASEDEPTPLADSEVEYSTDNTSWTGSTLTGAVTAIGTGTGTIKLLKDITTAAEITITGAVTLDLNGYYISGNNNHRIFVVNAEDKTFTIDDNSTAKTGVIKDGYYKAELNTPDGGAAVRVDSGTLLINGGTFQNCKADSTVSGQLYGWGLGGAIMGNKDTTIAIQNASFSDNTAMFGGGAVAVDEGRLYVRNSIFNKNKVDDDNKIGLGTSGGGGVYIQNSSEWEFENCTFESNSIVGENMGGGAFYGSFAQGSFKNCTMDKNSCSSNGGAISIYVGDAKFDKCTITNNTATAGNGGALALILYSSENSITNSVITENNSGNYGGGVYIGYDGANSSGAPGITVTNSRIDGNKATKASDDFHNNVSGFNISLNSAYTDSETNKNYNVKWYYDGMKSGTQFERYNPSAPDEKTNVSSFTSKDGLKAIYTEKEKYYAQYSVNGKTYGDHNEITNEKSYGTIDISPTPGQTEKLYSEKKQDNLDEGTTYILTATPADGASLKSVRVYYKNGINEVDLVAKTTESTVTFITPMGLNASVVPSGTQKTIIVEVDFVKQSTITITDPVGREAYTKIYKDINTSADWDSRFSEENLVKSGDKIEAGTELYILGYYPFSTTSINGADFAGYAIKNADTGSYYSAISSINYSETTYQTDTTFDPGERTDLIAKQAFASFKMPANNIEFITYATQEITTKPTNATITVARRGDNTGLKGSYYNMFMGHSGMIANDKFAAGDYVVAKVTPDVNNKITGVSVKPADGGEALEMWYCNETGTSEVTELPEKGSVYVLFRMINEPVVIENTAEFTLFDAKLGSVPEEHGKVELKDNEANVTTQFAPNETVTIAPTAEKHYEFDSVKVTTDNGAEVPVTDNDDGTHSFTMPEEHVNVNVSFKKVAYGITRTKDDGVATVEVSHDGENTIDKSQWDEKVYISVSTEDNYKIKSVTVNGTPATEVTSAFSVGGESKTYSFTMPKEDAEIKVATEKVKFNVKTTAENGSITLLNGAESPIEWGATVEFTVSADTHYKLNGVTASPDVTISYDSASGVYSFTMPANDVSITAEYEKKAYEVKATAPNARVTGLEKSYKWGETVTFKAEADKWYVIEEVSSTPSLGITKNDDGTYSFTMPQQEVELNIITTRPQFNISFVSKGGSAVSGQVVYNGDTITKPSVPEKVNYGFAGWYLDEAYTKKYDFSTPVTDEVTLYARWFLWGDVDGSGTANATDSMLIKRWYAGYITESDIKIPIAARVSGPDKVSPNATDSMYIKRHYAGYIDRYPVEDSAKGYEFDIENNTYHK